MRITRFGHQGETQAQQIRARTTTSGNFASFVFSVFCPRRELTFLEGDQGECGNSNNISRFQAVVALLLRTVANDEKVWKRYSSHVPSRVGVGVHSSELTSSPPLRGNGCNRPRPLPGNVTASLVYISGRCPQSPQRESE